MKKTLLVLSTVATLATLSACNETRPHDFCEVEGSIFCEGNFLLTCKENVKTLSQNCAEQGKSCDAEAKQCVESCQQDSKRCHNGNVERCVNKSWKLETTCVDPQRCDEASKTCTGNDVVVKCGDANVGDNKCENGQRHTCQQDGQWLLNPCASNEVCLDGQKACVTKNCEEGAKLCKNNVLEICKNNAWSDKEEDGAVHCASSSQKLECKTGESACSPQPECSNGATRCNAKVLQVCKDGKFENQTPGCTEKQHCFEKTPDQPDHQASCVACVEDGHCEGQLVCSDKHTCVACKKAGDKICSGQLLYTCQEDLSYGKGKSCGDTMYCSSKTKQCEPFACSNDADCQARFDDMPSCSGGLCTCDADPQCTVDIHGKALYRICTVYGWTDPKLCETDGFGINACNAEGTACKSCGNNFLDNGEQCDGSNVSSCPPNTTGTASCTSDCQNDFSPCVVNSCTTARCLGTTTFIACKDGKELEPVSCENGKCFASNPNLGCVECAQDSDCTVVNPLNSCNTTTHRCEARSCTAGETLCIPAIGTRVRIAICTSEGKFSTNASDGAYICPTGSVCSGDQKACTCTSDNCAGNKILRCMSGVFTTTESCPTEKPHCKKPKGQPSVCVECTQDSHCTVDSKKACNKESNVCVECTENKHCTTGQTCSDNVCV